MKNKFACGASVTKGKDEIVIQGDVQDDLYEIVTSFKVDSFVLNFLITLRTFPRILSTSCRTGRRYQLEIFKNEHVNKACC